MLKSRKFAWLALALVLPVFLLSDAAAEKAAVKKEDAKEMHGPTQAVCIIYGLGESKVRGKVLFTQKGEDVEINGTIVGLTPGEHGFHVHEFGDISAPDGMSAGGHFNPDKKMHGGPHSDSRHVGDLGNVTADDTGKATIHVTDKLVKLHGPHSIIGRSLVVHAKADDLKSQPSGEAGGRIGVGVIGIGKAEGAK